MRPSSVSAATRNGPVNSARNSRWSYFRCMYTDTTMKNFTADMISSDGTNDQCATHAGT
jgi:hypothetical protein